LGNVEQIASANVGTVTILLAVVGIVGIAIGVFALVRIGAITRRFSWVTRGEAGNVDTLPALLRAVESNQRDVAMLKESFDAAVVEARTHFKRLGIVRYNAFDGVAGQQSYSLCLLDENRNGILISNLVGTNFSRGYAVEIKAGQPARPLGDEESEALAAATRNGN
jgi:Protein of unknown function (DUF4446)